METLTNWRVLANCRGRTELFFAPDRERPPARRARESAALVLCAACPVQSACEDSRGESVGIWGGRTD
jgi:WhiB family redox-sensing transcriptional regulator